MNKKISIDLMNDLIMDKEIVNCINAASAKFKRRIGTLGNIEINDISQEAFLCFIEAVKGKKYGNINLERLREIRDMQSLKNYIISVVFWRVQGNLMYKEFGIGRTRQNDYWRYYRVKRFLLDKNIPLNDNNFIKEFKKLGWSWTLDKLYENYRYDNRIQNRVYVPDMDRYSIKMKSRLYWN